MNQSNFSYNDQENIALEVTLRTGAVLQGLQCHLLRSYSRQYDDCDAQAIIYFNDINRMVSNGVIVKYSNYQSFKDPSNKVWKIHNYRQNSIPQPPGLIFSLMK